MRLLFQARSGWWLVALALVLTSPPALAQQKPEAGTRQYRAAAGLQRSGQFELAAQAWAEFLQQFPKHSFAPQATLNLGTCYLKSDKLEQAQESFQTLIKNHPKFEMLQSAYLYLGITQYSIARSGKPEQYDVAAETFQTLKTKYPKGKHLAKAIFYRGESLYGRGEKKEAAAMYAQLVEQFPRDDLAVDALYALGVAQEELGDYKTAGKSYDAFMEKYPQNPLAVEVGMRRGETLFAAKQFEAAAEWFAYAAGHKGFRLADHATLRQAAALAQLKKHTEAAALYASVPKKFPKSRYVKSANLTGGKCYYLADNMEEARKLLAEVLAVGGESAAEAAHWIARSLLKQNKPAEALTAAEKGLPQAGKSPYAVALLMDRADAIYEIPERRAESAALYAALASKHPKAAESESALYMAGFAALGQEEFNAALKHSTAFLKKYPDNKLVPDVMAVAAESNLQLGKLPEAETLYDKLLAKYAKRRDAESWKVRRALALHLQKKYEPTIAALEPVLSEIRTPAAVAEANYLLGNSRAELGQLDQAIKRLEASLAADPKWRQADQTLLVLANAYRRKNDLNRAMATVRKLIAEFPDSRLMDRAHYWLGEYAYTSGDFKTAAGEYQAVVKSWPKSKLVPYALYGLGWSQLNRKDFAAAEKTIDRLVKEHPKHKLIARARYARGTARQQLGKFAPAVEDLQALLAADPTPVEKSNARYLLGLCQVGLKKHAEAAATLAALLKDGPDYADADKVLYELAWALEATKKEAEAARHFAQLAKQYPDSPLAAEALYHVGEAQYKNKEYAEAAMSYYQAAEKATDPALEEKTNHKLGWSYFHQDQFHQGQQTFAYQRKTWPKGKLASDAALMEGQCLFELEKFEQALAAYTAVKEPSSEDFKALSLLRAAQAAARLKQWEKSLELSTNCAQQFPDSSYLPEVLYQQGWAEQNLGKPDEAVKSYRAVIAKTNREVAARAQFMIGEILFEKKDHAEAIKTYYTVIYGYSFPRWQANATFEAARCFEVLKKKSQSVKLYEELLQKYPDSDKTPAAKNRLEALKQ